MKRSLPVWMIGCATAPLVGLGLAAPRLTTDAPQERELLFTPAVNPHWSAQGCGECHTVSDGTTSPIKHEEVDLLCLRCHDGKRATREAHPIGRTFAGSQVRKPDGWPTVQDALSCITCHDILRGCDANARRPRINPQMLRGDATAPSMQFCATCHVQELHARFNPHEMLDNAGSRIDDSCRWCHESEAIARIPDARHGLPGLLADEATLCGRCHSTHIDYFTPGHMGAAVTTDMLAAMLRTDAELGLAKGDDRTRALPLDQRNAIGCSTCHNPHQAGLFPEDSDLALGEISGTRRQIVPLRLPGTQLCIACHEK